MRTRFIAIVALGVLLLGVGFAQAAESLWFTPLNAVIVPPATGQNTFIQLSPGSNGASLVISVDLNEAFTNSPQWVNIPLSSLPAGMKIAKFVIYYQVSAETTNTYIAEEKLAKLTYPKTLTSVYDITSTLNKQTPSVATFTPKIPILVSGTMNLMLRVKMDSLIDSISIGAIEVFLQ
ncbi:MAG: hypothetical protein P4L55_00230 [Syntrophobacteraceae bacterium]|nr:hypothetical protein [Syntrophobacteraceae bacterium]